MTDKSKDGSAGKMRTLRGFPRYLAFAYGVTLTIITFYTAVRGVFLPIIERSLHLCLLMSIIFLWFPATKNHPTENPSLFDYFLSLLSLGVLAWTLYSSSRFITRIPYYGAIFTLDKCAGGILVLLVLESGRRTLGLFITCLASILIMYAFAGPYMPQMLAHPGISFSRFIDVMYMTDMGLWGSLMGTSATLLFMFIAFGVALQATNTDKRYMNVSLALAGAKPGGPAKVSVLSSAAMGTISGSTIANVVSTGTLTIPLMKKTGYSPEEAGAIETVASAGGQIMPPIMGTGAFIMADFIGKRYFDIVKVSILPAILFYSTLWFFIDLKAKRKGLKGLSKEHLPSLSAEMHKYWYMFIPIFMLLLLLFWGFTPFLSGAFCCFLVIFFSCFQQETRLSLKEFFLMLENCSINVAKIAGIIACAAIIVSMINTTGLMLKSTSIILYLSRGNLPFTIIIEGIIAYVLGMGLPIATSYVILATLGAPALAELGIPMMAAHLMIFWFAQLSTITPPVCLTAFAAAGISDANPMKTGFTALPMGATFYVVPILFLFSDLLNVTTEFPAAFIDFLLAMVGAYCFAVGVEGYISKYPIPFMARILALISSLLFLAATFNYFTAVVSSILTTLAVFLIFSVYLLRIKMVIVM